MRLSSSNSIKIIINIFIKYLNFLQVYKNSSFVLSFYFQLLISGSTSAHEFEDVQVDEGQRILADLHIDPTRRFAFVASPYKVSTSFFFIS